MRIFVTGGTGYIGRALVRRLAGEGHEVRCLVRPGSDAAGLAALGAACFAGDVTDRHSMREGMSAAEWVIHAAADLDFRAPAERMRRVNVEGSENVASLAWKLGVGRLLAISSIAVFGGSPDDGSAATEESPPILPLPSPYAVTKRAGEEAIQRWAAEGLRVNTVHPSVVYGPPGKREGANSFLRALLARRFAAVVGAEKIVSWVFLDDLVDGLMRAVARAAPGRSYLLTGEATSVGSLVERVCRLGGVRPPRLRLSVGSARLALALTTPLFRLLGRRPLFNVYQLRNLGRNWRFDDGRARAELGWRPRSLDEGLPPTVEFLLGRTDTPA